MKYLQLFGVWEKAGKSFWFGFATLYGVEDQLKMFLSDKTSNRPGLIEPLLQCQTPCCSKVAQSESVSQTFISPYCRSNHSEIRLTNVFPVLFPSPGPSWMTWSHSTVLRSKTSVRLGLCLQKKHFFCFDQTGLSDKIYNNNFMFSHACMRTHAHTPLDDDAAKYMSISKYCEILICLF